MPNHFSLLTETQSVPHLDSIQNREYVGRRTTSAVVVVGSHVRSFYRLFVIIILLIIMITFGIISILLGIMRKNSCTSKVDVSQQLISFGITELIFCGIIMLMVCWI